MDAETSPSVANERLAPAPDPSTGWTNPVPQGRYDLVVIGDDVGVTRVAQEAARSGRKVALAGRRPGQSVSRAQVWAAVHALRRLARLASRVAGDKAFGGSMAAGVDFAEAMQWAREVRAKTFLDESPETLARQGIDVYCGRATFTRHDALRVEDCELTFRRALVATGSRPVSTSVDGADQAGCLTSDDVLELEELPRRLAVIGVGPRACCWAQTFRRLGSEVYLIGRGETILPSSEPEAVSLIEGQFEKEGIRFRRGCERLSVRKTGNLWAVTSTRKGRQEKLFVDRVLLDDVREPNTAGLALEAAGVASTARGVLVGGRLQTTNRRVFAAGDVCGDAFFCPEVAEAMARLCLRNAFALFGRKFNQLVVPRAVWTDPEIIQIGLTPAEAAARQIKIDTYRAELAQADAAVPGCAAGGFAAVHVRRGSGRIVGAGVVGEEAGELIGPLALLMAGKLSLGALGDVIPCHPTRFEVLRRLADRFLQAPRPSRWARLTAAWGRGRKRTRRKGMHGGDSVSSSLD